MSISWSAVIQGITTGVVGALVFWSFGLLRDLVRSMWLRHTIRHELKFVSCGSGLQGVTMSIRNHLQKSFFIRDVSLVTGEMYYALNATGEITSSLPTRKIKLTKIQKAALKKGETIQVGSQMAHRSWRANPDHTGFVELKPFTSQQFLLPAELSADFKGDSQRLLITVEYVTWSKKTRILEQRIEGHAIDMMKKMIESYRQQLLSGNLNQARKMFSLPPINIPIKKAEA